MSLSSSPPTNTAPDGGAAIPVRGFMLRGDPIAGDDTDGE